MRTEIYWNAKRLVVLINNKPLTITLNGRDPYKVYEEVKSILNRKLRLVA